MTRAPSEPFTRTLQTAGDATYPRWIKVCVVGGIIGVFVAPFVVLVSLVLPILTPWGMGLMAISWTALAIGTTFAKRVLRETAASDPVEQEQGGLP